ncbi:MAG: TIGR00266 family protein [Vicinamibacterales bacterium]
MVAHEIIGDDMQAVIISMTTGDTIRAEAGAMMFMTDGVDMDAKMEGGFLGGLKRKLLAGESFFITYFKCTAPSARVAFAGPYPGKIIHVDIGPGRPILCQKDGFLCAVGDVDINIAFTKRIGAGFFGGEGFILQKLEGQGQTFIHAGGTIVEMMLKPGEPLRVDTGCLVAFDESVSYEIERVGGIKTSLFGGEGLFFAAMRGPGRVWLQTLPFSRLADRIHSAYRADRGETKRDLGGLLGGLGDLIGGDR